MKRLNRLDFIAPAPTPVLGWSMTVVSAVVLAYVGAQLWTLQSDGQSLARRLASTDAIVSAATTPPPSDALVRAQAIVPANPAVILPWSEVLAAFDEHVTPRMGLLKFEPDAQGRMRVTARARDAQTVVTFLRELEADRRLKDVSLVQQTTDSNTPERPVSFTVLAAWRGDERARDRGVEAR